MKQNTLNKILFMIFFVGIALQSWSQQSIYFPIIQADSVEVERLRALEYIEHPDGVLDNHSATVGQIRDSLLLYHTIEDVDSIITVLMDTISANSLHIDSL